MGRNILEIRDDIPVDGLIIWDGCTGELGGKMPRIQCSCCEHFIQCTNRDRHELEEAYKKIRNHEIRVHKKKC